MDPRPPGGGAPSVPAPPELAAALPPHVRGVVARLAAAGFETVAVGGGVRDALLGRPVGGLWDLATQATPPEVIALFPDAVPTGVEHGTVTLPHAAGAIEIDELPRPTSAHSDARRPDRVEFGVSLAGDLARRDFTVNALAYDPGAGSLFDPTRRARRPRRARACARWATRRRASARTRCARCAPRGSPRCSASRVEPATRGRPGRPCATSCRASRQERVRDELGRMLLAPRPERRASSCCARAGLLPLLPARARRPASACRRTASTPSTSTSTRCAPSTSRAAEPRRALGGAAARPRQAGDAGRVAGRRGDVLRPRAGRRRARRPPARAAALAARRNARRSSTWCASTCSTTAPSGPTPRCGASCAASGRRRCADLFALRARRRRGNAARAARSRGTSTRSASASQRCWRSARRWPCATSRSTAPTSMRVARRRARARRSGAPCRGCSRRCSTTRRANERERQLARLARARARRAPAGRRVALTPLEAEAILPLVPSRRRHPRGERIPGMDWSRVQRPVRRELAQVDRQLATLFRSPIAILNQVGGHVLATRGKKFRPTLLLLVARLSGEGRPAS